MRRSTSPPMVIETNPTPIRKWPADVVNSGAM
jgi:hypothetical protein